MNLLEAARALRESIEGRHREKKFDLELFRRMTAAPEFRAEIPTAERANLFRELARESLDYPFVASLVAQHIATELIARFSPGGRKLADSFASSVLAVGNHEDGCSFDLRAMRSRFDPCAGEGQVEKPIVTNGAHAEIALLSFWRELGGKSVLQIAAFPLTALRRTDLASAMRGFHTGSTGSVAVAAPAPALMRPLFEFSPAVTFEMFRACFDLERTYLNAAMEGLRQGLEIQAGFPGKTALRVLADVSDPELAHRELSRARLARIAELEESLQKLETRISPVLTAKVSGDIPYLKRLGGSPALHQRIADGEGPGDVSSRTPKRGAA